MKYRSFDTYEEAVAAMDEAREAADKQVKSWQEKIKPGDHFVQATEYGFIIFGVVLQPGDDKFLKSKEGRHYRFCECFSVACEDGEKGDVHISVIGKLITEEAFNRFRDKGWVVEDGDLFV